VTGLEVIVAALAAGAGAGAGDAANAAVFDAYTGLKGLLRRRLVARPQAVEVLDAEQTDPQVWQARLGPHLAAADTDHDDEVLTAARRLLELADPEGTQAGKYQLDLQNAQQPQIGDNSIRIDTNYGPAAGSMTGPVTVTYPGPLPVPPAAPGA
jgi:hypothetical protein